MILANNNWTLARSSDVAFEAALQFDMLGGGGGATTSEKLL
jgi:hypothetical protein